MTINISLLFQDNKMKFSGYEICLAWLEIDQSTCKYKNQPDWSKVQSMFFKWTGLDWTGLDWIGLVFFINFFRVGGGGGVCIIFSIL